MPRRRTGSECDKLSGAALGKRIHEIRIEKGITLQKLASGAGVQASFINQLEKGEKVPGFDTLIGILNTLEVSADEILYDYIKNPAPDTLNRSIGRKLKDATEQQLRHIEAHIALELSLDKEIR